MAKKSIPEVREPVLDYGTTIATTTILKLTKRRITRNT